MPFDVVEAQLSVDGRQVLVEIRPAEQLITDVSRCSH